MPCQQRPVQSLDFHSCQAVMRRPAPLQLHLHEGPQWSRNKNYNEQQKQKNNLDSFFLLPFNMEILWIGILEFICFCLHLVYVFFLQTWSFNFNFLVCRIICFQKEKKLYQKVYSGSVHTPRFLLPKSLLPLPSPTSPLHTHTHPLYFIISGLTFLCFLCKNKRIYVCKLYYVPFFLNRCLAPEKEKKEYVGIFMVIMLNL